MPIPIDKEGASTFVLACIDPRFTEYLAKFLINEKDIAHDYDLFALAGASLGANQTKHKCWGKALMEHIDVAIDLHGIKQLLVFDHLDCGAYKIFLELDEDDDVKPHKKEIKKLEKKIKKKYPDLEFRGFIMGKTGKIYRV